MMESKDYEFRLVERADELNLFEWRSDPVTVARSLFPEPTQDEHDAWMFRGVCDPRIKRVIYDEAYPQQFDGTTRMMSVGQVTIRAYYGPAGDALQCPFQVGPAYRKQGVGTRMMTRLHGLLLGPRVAHVKPENEASRKILAACGFVEIDPTELWDRYRFTVRDGLIGLFRDPNTQ